MASFVADRIVMDGLTFDDVLLIPAYSDVLPKTVELKTRFSRNIELNIPFVTAAMDTVTESSMAIAIAREGGIGVIHKNMSIEAQAREVAIVKRAENGMIYDPVTIRLGSTVQDALDMMADYHIGGIPVVDNENRLVGIVTNRDLRFELHLDKKIDDVMTSENLVTTHQQTDLIAAAQILQENKIEKLPVVDKDNHLVGLITYKDITKAKDKPMACKDSKGRLRVAAGVGVTFDTLDRASALVEAGADAIVIDTAHGHSKGVIEKLREVKKAFPNVDIVVGNVATGDAAKLLVDNGKIIAAELGVPESVIALTVIALGTSLPELVTAITSLVKGHAALSLGNIVGANLFNLVLVSGMAITIRPFNIPADKLISGHNASLVVDIPVMFFVMAFMTIPALCTKKLRRYQGIVLLLVYAGYVTFQFFL